VADDKRYICTKTHPWDVNKGRAMHPDAFIVHSGDYYDRYECPNCGLQFDVEVPE